MASLSILGLFLLSLPLGYWYLLCFGAFLGRFRSPRPARLRAPTHRFAITIAAHDEVAVIAHTVSELAKQHYPRSLFDIHVVADWCTDQTAEAAEEAGAIAHRRQTGPRGGKGAALSWLFSRILGRGQYDAVVVFDADTEVSPNFLRVMDAALRRGESVIQGQHQIGNPGDGWFPALTQAKFLIDNEFHNFGRAHLGFSAKNMGDSICLRSDVLEEVGWGEGLTEDYQLRQKLLLAGYTITYAPDAIGRGEAPPTWKQARTQRLRWMKGAKDVSTSYRARLLEEALQTKSAVLLDAAAESYLPTFSTLAAVAAVGLGVQLAWEFAFGVSLPATTAWAVYLALLVAYPFLGLCLAGAPLRAFGALAGGPIFVAWRAWAAVSLTVRKTEVPWIRTQHGKASA